MMATTKMALFAFRGDPMCFIHVLLNGLDLAEQGHEVAIVLEGEATKLLGVLRQADHPLHTLYARARAGGLFAAVCRACATKMGVIDLVVAEGLPLGEDMHGHPSMSAYLARGYQIVTL